MYATQENTQGYTAAELDVINQRIAARVGEIPEDDQWAKSVMGRIMEEELARFDAENPVGGAR